MGIKKYLTKKNLRQAELIAKIVAFSAISSLTISPMVQSGSIYLNQQQDKNNIATAMNNIEDYLNYKSCKCSVDDCLNKSNIELEHENL